MENKEEITLVNIDIVEDKNISSNALACIAYIPTIVKNGEVSVKKIKERFGWGHCVWSKVSKELRKLDVLRLIATNKGRKLLFNDTKLLSRYNH